MAACLFVLAAGAADLTNEQLFLMGLVVDTPSNDTEQMGRKLLAEFTRQNIGKHLAVILFGQLDSAPVLKSEISSGTVWVGSTHSEETAKDLAAKINAAITKK